MQHFSLDEVWVSTMLVKSVLRSHLMAQPGQRSGAQLSLLFQPGCQRSGKCQPFKAPEIWLPVKEEEPGPWVSAAKMVSRSGATVTGEATVLPWLFYLRFQRERMLYVQ